MSVDILNKRMLTSWMPMWVLVFAALSGTVALAQVQVSVQMPTQEPTNASAAVRYGGLDLVRYCPHSLASEQKLGLSGLIQLALCNSAAVRVANANLQLRQKSLIQAQYERYPNASATLSRVRERSDSVGATTFTEKQSSQTSSLQINWRVYDFGVTEGRQGAAHSAVLAANASLDDAVLNSVANVLQPYYKWLGFQQSLKKLQQNDETMNENLQATRKRLQHGVSDQGDLLRATLQLNRLRVDKGKLVEQSAEQMSALMRALGVLLHSSQVQAQVQLLQQADLSAMPVSTERMDQELDEWLQLAQAHAPSIHSATHELEQARQELRSTLGERKPTLDYSMQRVINGVLGQALIPNQQRLSHSLTLNIPISDGLFNDSKVNTAQANVQLRIEQLQQARQEVQGKLHGWFLSMQQLRESLAFYDQLRRDAQGLTESVLKRQQAGLLDRLNFNEALSSQLEIENQYWQALADWRIAQLQLALHTGQHSALLALLQPQ